MGVKSRKSVRVLYHDPLAVGITAAIKVGVSPTDYGSGKSRFDRRADRSSEVDAGMSAAVIDLRIGSGKTGIAEVLGDMNIIQRPV